MIRSIGIVALVFGAIAGVARCQAPVQIQVVPTAPTGVCNGPLPVQVLYSNGQFYQCIGGTTTVAAQNPPIVQTSNGVPSNSCDGNWLDVDLTTGHLYTCLLGTWTLVSSGGSITPVNPFTNGVAFWTGSALTTTASPTVGLTLCLVSVNGAAPVFGACSGSAATAFSSITAGTNTAALIIGSGGTLSATGTGSISATTVSESLQSFTVDASTALNLSTANLTLPSANGFTANATNSIGVDGLTGLIHIYQNTADAIAAYWLPGVPPVNGHCVAWGAAGLLTDTGSACGSGGGSVTASGPLTGNSVIKGAGASVIQVSGLSIDINNNLTSPGSFSFALPTAAQNLVTISGPSTPSWSSLPGSPWFGESIQMGGSIWSATQLLHTVAALNVQVLVPASTALGGSWSAAISVACASLSTGVNAPVECEHLNALTAVDNGYTTASSIVAEDCYPSCGVLGAVSHPAPILQGSVVTYNLTNAASNGSQTPFHNGSSYGSYVQAITHGSGNVGHYLAHGKNAVANCFPATFNVACVTPDFAFMSEGGAATYALIAEPVDVGASQPSQIIKQRSTSSGSVSQIWLRSITSANVATENAPAGGSFAWQVNGSNVASLDTTGNVTAQSYIANGTLHGSLTLNELPASGTDAITIDVPDSVTNTYTIRLPGTQPASNQYMQCGAPSGGVSTCTWQTVTATTGATCNADLQAGADLSQQVIACDTANGITIDASRYSTAQTWGTAWTLAHSNVHFIGPPVTVTATVNNAITVTGNNNDLSAPGGTFLRGANNLLLIRFAGSTSTTVNLATSNVEPSNSVTTATGTCGTLGVGVGNYFLLADVGTANGNAAHIQMVRAGSVCSTDTFTLDGNLMESFYSVAGATAQKVTPTPSGNKLHNWTIDGNAPTFTDTVSCFRDLNAVFTEVYSTTFQNCDATAIWVKNVYGGKYHDNTIINSGNSASAALAENACTNCDFHDNSIDLKGKTGAFATNFLQLHGSSVSKLLINNGGANGRAFKTTDSSYNVYSDVTVQSPGAAGWVCFKAEHSDRHNVYSNFIGVGCTSVAWLFSENASFSNISNTKLIGHTSGAVQNAIDVTSARQIKQSGLTVTATNLTATTGTFQVTAGMTSLNWAQPTGSLGDYYDTIGPDPGHPMTFCFSGFANAGNNSCFQITAINSTGSTVTVSGASLMVTEAGATGISMVGFYDDSGNIFNGFEFTKSRSGGTPYYIQITGNDWQFNHGYCMDDQGHTSGCFTMIDPPNFTAGQTVYSNLRNQVNNTRFQGFAANKDIVLAGHPTNGKFSANDFAAGITAGTTGTSNVFWKNFGTRPACDATSGPILRGSNWFVENAVGADSDFSCKKDGAGNYAWGPP